MIEEDILFREYEQKHNKKDFVAGLTYIPASGPDIDFKDLQNLVNTVFDGWFTEWKQAHKFSDKLSSVSNKKYTTLVNSGSSANLIAVAAMCEDNPNPYIVTCAAGFPTTVAPIYQNNRVPIFVDIDPFTLVPKLNEVLDALRFYKDQVAGVILSANLGFSLPERVIKEQLEQDQKFILDGCDALGSRFWVQEGDSVYPVPVGHYADMLTYSFFPAHVITTGEGGAVLTNDPYLYEALRSFASWGRSCRCLPGQQNVCGQRFCWPGLADLPEGFDHKYVFDRVGYNLKMTELSAALGNTQIDRLEDFILARRANYHRLYSALELVSLHDLYVYELSDGVNPFGFPMLLGAEIDINHFIAYLESKKIGSRRFFSGNLIRQPGYYLQKKVQMSSLVGSDLLMNKLVWVGCQPALIYDMIDYMSETILSYFKEHKSE